MEYSTSQGISCIDLFFSFFKFLFSLTLPLTFFLFLRLSHSRSLSTPKTVPDAIFLENYVLTFKSKLRIAKWLFSLSRYFSPSMYTGPNIWPKFKRTRIQLIFYKFFNINAYFMLNIFFSKLSRYFKVAVAFLEKKKRKKKILLVIQAYTFLKLLSVYEKKMCTRVKKTKLRKDHIYIFKLSINLHNSK